MVDEQQGGWRTAVDRYGYAVGNAVAIFAFGSILPALLFSFADIGFPDEFVGQGELTDAQLLPGLAFVVILLALAGVAIALGMRSEHLTGARSALIVAGGGVLELLVLTTFLSGIPLFAVILVGPTLWLLQRRGLVSLGT